MTVTAYTNISSKNTVTKTLLNETVISGTLRDDCDVLNPVITLSKDVSYFCGSNGFNYVYINAFQRYYYIEKTEVVKNDSTRVFLHCDVLMSWSDEIRSNTALISRQSSESVGNKYLDDAEYVTTSKKSYNTFKFEDEPDAGTGCVLFVCTSP